MIGVVLEDMACEDNGGPWPLEDGDAGAKLEAMIGVVLEDMACEDNGGPWPLEDGDAGAKLENVLEVNEDTVEDFAETNDEEIMLADTELGETDCWEAKDDEEL